MKIKILEVTQRYLNIPNFVRIGMECYTVRTKNTNNFETRGGGGGNAIPKPNFLVPSTLIPIIITYGKSVCP